MNQVLHFATMACYSSAVLEGELQAAKDELAHLEETAKRLAADLRQVADWVESAASPDFLQKAEIQQREDKLSSKHKWRRYSEALNFQMVVEVVSRVTKARKKVHDLQRPLTSL